MRPLIKRTFRPPNYETPVALLGEPLTPNDAFCVRWHMGVPDLARESWRLRIAGRPHNCRRRARGLGEWRRRSDCDGRYAWRPWRFDFDPPGLGNLTLRVRATADNGATQPEALVLNPAGDHHNIVQQATCRAA